MATSDVVQARARLRFRIIEALYDHGKAALNFYKEPKWFVQVLSEEDEEIRNAIRLLAQQNLVKTMGTNLLTGLTAAGIAEYEQSMATKKETKHFPDYVVQQTQHFHGPVGSVQSGAHSTANVQQNIGTKAEDLLTLLAQLRTEVAALPTERRAPAEQAVRMIEKQAKTEEPDKDVLDVAQEKLEKAVDGLEGFTRVVELVGRVAPLLLLLTGGGA